MEVLKTELSLEPIRADAVTFLRAAHQILHLEFQTLPPSNPPLPLRMLDYAVRLKRQYQCDVEQVVIFLKRTTSEVVFTQEYQDRTTAQRYRVIRMWEENVADFLAHPALLPLATLTRTDSPRTLLGQVAQQIARIPEREQQQNLSGCAQILAGLRFELAQSSRRKRFRRNFEKELIRQLFREEVMRESVIYQDILQQGLQQGRQQEALSFVVRLLNRQLGAIDSALIERLQGLTIEQLEELGEALLDFSDVADLVLWLNEQPS